MAVPKKKVSRSRRNMRRFASGNKMSPVTWVVQPGSGTPTKPHRVTLESLVSYLETKAARKQEKQKTSQK